MGGTSTQQQQQSSTTAPWTAAQPALTGILSQLNGLVPNSGLSSTSQGAIGTLENNAYAGNPYAPQISGLASNLLGGGGANAQVPQVQGNLSTLQGQLTPYANGSMIGQNPALQGQLDQIRNDVTQQVNGQFAAAGRAGSGMNQQTLARGIAQGEAPVIAGQYNQDVANQQNAAGTLYNGGNATAGLLAGLNQTGLSNQLQGAQTSQDALSAQNYTPQQLLQLEQMKQQIPAQNLGLLAQIGVPIAGLGSQSTGQSSGQSTMSGAQQFATIAGGIGSLGNLWNPKSSDARLKQDIAKVGELYDGTPVYLYRYSGSPTFEIGLMAQDVEKTTPAAIVEIDGYKAVDYKTATDTARKLAEAA